MFGKKILIIGANSFIGSSIYYELRNKYEWDIIGSSQCQKDGLIEINLKNQSQINYAIDFLKPDYILHLAAITNPNWCEHNKTATLDVNYYGVRRFISAIENQKTKFVFFSTDYVFDGECPPYSERARKKPANFYGKSKSLSEDYIQKHAKDYLILRLPIIYGLDRSQNLLKPLFLNSIISNVDIVKLDHKQIRFPVWVNSVIDAVITVLNLNLTGIMHLTGQEPTTKYEWGQAFAKATMSKTRLIPTEDTSIPRPLNAKLISLRSELENQETTNLQTGMEIIINQLRNQKDTNI